MGYTDDREAGLEADLLPVTLNYRFAQAARGNFGYFAGAGAGFARASIDGASISGPVSLHDTAFAAQAFAGLSYQAGPSTTLNLGVKYLWIDDMKFAGVNVDVDDDVAVQAGFTFKF